MTKYLIEYEKNGHWVRSLKLFDSMSSAELEAAFYKEHTRIVTIEGTGPREHK